MIYRLPYRFTVSCYLLTWNAKLQIADLILREVSIDLFLYFVQSKFFFPFTEKVRKNLSPY